MKKYYLLILAAITILYTSCSKDENGNNNNISGEPTVATFTISTPRTYASTEAGSDEENTISVLEFYVFESNEERDAINGGYHKATLNPAATPSNNELQPISFLVGSGNNKTVLVAINLSLGDMAGQNLDVVEKKIIDATSKLTKDNSQSIPTGGPAMSGIEKGISITADKLNNEIKVYVSRLVGKINSPAEKTGGVKVTLKDSDIEEVFGSTLDKDNSKIAFSLKSYAVINGLDLSQTFTYGNSGAGWEYWDRSEYWTPTKGYQRSTFNSSDGSLVTAYSGVNKNITSSAWLPKGYDNPVYIYENNPLPRISNNGLVNGYDRETVYAYLIEGTLTHAEDASNPVTRYWRINLIVEEAFQMFRNAVYKVTLEEVISKGYGTAKEAEEDKDGGEDGGQVIPGSGETGIKADIEIVPWQIKTSGVKF